MDISPPSFDVSSSQWYKKVYVTYTFKLGWAYYEIPVTNAFSRSLINDTNANHALRIVMFIHDKIFQYSPNKKFLQMQYVTRSLLNMLFLLSCLVLHVSTLTDTSFGV
jgi:hypothetical protein